MTDGGGPRVSVVILSWNTRELLTACLASLRDLPDATTRELIVVDNASADGSADMVARDFPQVTLVRNAENQGYTAGNNTGAARATGEFLFLVNSDTELRPGALDTLVGFLDGHPGHAACAPRLDRPDGTPQPSCKTFPMLRTAVFYDTIFDRWFPGNRVLPHYEMRDFDHTTTRDVDQPPGAALLVRRALFEQLGGLDERMWLFYSDVDFCRRLSAGGQLTAYVAEARVLHHEGKSTGQYPEFGAIWHKDRLAYYRCAFGWRGTLVARVMSTLRGWEEARKLKRNGAPAEARAAVWRAVRAVWAA
ncbi:MAG: glycosyltransferase family 2 protein [Planctomycetota bacterium]|jgi:GT2 family glycosyltransferase